MRGSIHAWIGSTVAVLSVLGGLFYYSQSQGKYIQKVENSEIKSDKNEKEIENIKLNLREIKIGRKYSSTVSTKMESIDDKYQSDISHIREEIVRLKGVDKELKLEIKHNDEWIEYVNDQISIIQEDIKKASERIISNSETIQDN